MTAARCALARCQAGGDILERAPRVETHLDTDMGEQVNNWHPGCLDAWHREPQHGQPPRLPTEAELVAEDAASFGGPEPAEQVVTLHPDGRVQVDGPLVAPRCACRDAGGRRCDDVATGPDGWCDYCRQHQTDLHTAAYLDRRGD